LVNVAANNRIGLGHVYNILTILPHFQHDQILVVMEEDNSLGCNKLQEKYDVQLFSDIDDFIGIVDDFTPDIIINDILNTKRSYMIRLIQDGRLVVNFEDLGPGAKLADLVFNAIYWQSGPSNTFYGEKYACVRDEFRRPLPECPGNSVVITFGGVDPQRLTLRVLHALQRRRPEYQLFVIIGDAFAHADRVLEAVQNMKNDGIRVDAVVKTDAIADYVDQAMFAITANGRTVFEVAARLIPTITISANTREEEHMFPKRRRVGHHLGLYSKIKEQDILRAVTKMELVENRQACIKELEKVRIRDSVYNVIRLINEKFYCLNNQL